MYSLNLVFFIWFLLFVENDAFVIAIVGIGLNRLPVFHIVGSFFHVTKPEWIPKAIFIQVIVESLVVRQRLKV